KAWYIACNHFALLVAIAGGLAACAFASIRITESFFYQHLAAMGVLLCPPVYFGYVVYFSNWVYPQVSCCCCFNMTRILGSLRHLQNIILTCCPTRGLGEHAGSLQAPSLDRRHDYHLGHCGAHYRCFHHLSRARVHQSDVPSLLDS